MMKTFMETTMTVMLPTKSMSKTMKKEFLRVISWNATSIVKQKSILHQALEKLEVELAQIQETFQKPHANFRMRKSQYTERIDSKDAEVA